MCYVGAAGGQNANVGMLPPSDSEEESEDETPAPKKTAQVNAACLQQHPFCVAVGRICALSIAPLLASDISSQHLPACTMSGCTCIAGHPV